MFRLLVYSFWLSAFSPIVACSQSLLTFAGGNMSGSGLDVSWSVGELVVSTVEGGEGGVTQGYQQPSDLENIDTLAENDITVNVITANGDDINDNFLIANVETMPNNRLIIINRWREIVYQTDGYHNEWQGQTKEGRLLPQAAYYYTFYPDKKSKGCQRGTIHILR